MGITITIDPGHGSAEYPGALYPPYVEKDMALAVSLVIKDRLEQFDGVNVVLTRSNDTLVELKGRCDIAKATNSNYFFSIHFNSSADHEAYGSEIYLPVQSKYYNEMYPVANELLNSFDAMGLVNRGIKAKTNSNGNDNYYAVLKYASNYGIPSCIIEHCHLDNANDTVIIPFNSVASYNYALTTLGLQDAEAIARGLHLKSTSLGIDYTNYKTAKSTRTGIISHDKTAPEKNTVELVFKTDNTVTLKLTAKDSNSNILYYKISTDGGITYTSRMTWPQGTNHKGLNSFTTTIDNPSGGDLNIVTCVYNSYDLFTLSNVLTVSNSYAEVKDLSADNINSAMNVLYSPLLVGIIAILAIKKLF